MKELEKEGQMGGAPRKSSILWQKEERCRTTAAWQNE